MALYFFDLRDEAETVVDEEGTELRDLRAVQDEAARALSGLAWDAMRSDCVKGHQMIIEVRDSDGPVMEAKLSFEIARKQ
jgi:Domain of unknown function (DUF6894)